MDELYDSLKAMKCEAVPGEDGFTVDFYLTFWNEVKDLVFQSYMYAFEANHLSLTQRRGIIRLIPKRDKNLLFVSSWHPITLLNVDFKMLTKLFSVRLAKFLPDLVHPDQRGFIKQNNS